MKTSTLIQEGGCWTFIISVICKSFGLDYLRCMIVKFTINTFATIATITTTTTAVANLLLLLRLMQ